MGSSRAGIHPHTRSERKGMATPSDRNLRNAKQEPFGFDEPEARLVAQNVYTGPSWQARRMLDLLTPIFRAIAFHDKPWPRSSITKSRQKTTRGRPIGCPLLVPPDFARANPALIRSEIGVRSCFAKLASKLMITSLNGPALSSQGSVRLRQRTP